MFYISDVVNTTNIKRVGRWCIKNPRYVIVLCFAFLTIGYKYYKKQEFNKRWDGVSVGFFKKLTENGNLQMIIGQKIMDISFTNYVIPRFNKEIKNNDDKCENQLHLYFKALLKDKLNGTKTIKVMFDKDGRHNVIKNAINSGFHSKVTIDDENLNEYFINKQILCNLNGMRNTKNQKCDWCHIRDIVGLQAY